MTHDEENEDECPGQEECDNPDCDDRDIFYVEVDVTISFEVRAHDLDEAQNIVALEVEPVGVSEPDNELITNWEADEDITVRSTADMKKQAAESQRIADMIRARKLEVVK